MATASASADQQLVAEAFAVLQSVLLLCRSAAAQLVDFLLQDPHVIRYLAIVSLELLYRGRA